jgi:hypothetical protein
MHYTDVRPFIITQKFATAVNNLRDMSDIGNINNNSDFMSELEKMEKVTDITSYVTYITEKFGNPIIKQMKKVGITPGTLSQFIEKCCSKMYCIEYLNKFVMLVKSKQLPEKYLKSSDWRQELSDITQNQIFILHDIYIFLRMLKSYQNTIIFYGGLQHYEMLKCFFIQNGYVEDVEFKGSDQSKRCLLMNPPKIVLKFGNSSIISLVHGFNENTSRKLVNIFKNTALSGSVNSKIGPYSIKDGIYTTPILSSHPTVDSWSLHGNILLILSPSILNDIRWDGYITESGGGTLLSKPYPPYNKNTISNYISESEKYNEAQEEYVTGEIIFPNNSVITPYVYAIIFKNDITEDLFDLITDNLSNKNKDDQIRLLNLLHIDKSGYITFPYTKTTEDTMKLRKNVKDHLQTEE